MKYTWFLFLGLLVAGGSIAFMGDRLGRYMGKRRMTIFGLRPRHTALLFTVILSGLHEAAAKGPAPARRAPCGSALPEPARIPWPGNCSGPPDGRGCRY